MSMTMGKTAVSCLALAAASGAAHAQNANQTGPLSTFATNAATNASAGQRRTAFAVQGMCRALATEGGFTLQGTKRDLFLRCNEMVETARTFEGLTGSTARSLGYTDRVQLLAAVQQVSGEELAAQGVLSTQVSSGQFANISGRLSALRIGGEAASARGRVAMLDEPAGVHMLADALGPQREVAYALGGGAAADSQSSEASRLGWFVESSYGFGDHDQTTNEDAFDFDSISFTTGLDYNFGSSVAGVSVGYDLYNADFDGAVLVSGGEVEVRGISGSVFGGLFGAGWTLNGIATYGQLESEVTRRAVYASQNAACTFGCGTSRDLTGEPDGDYVALGLTLGYEITAGGWDIAPSLSASYRDVSIDGYDERDRSTDGGLALRYDEQSIESLRSILGIAVSRPISRSFGVLVPSLRAEWHHEFEDDARAVRAKYLLEDALLANASGARDFGCSISCFSMPVDRADEDYAIASLGVSATFAQRMQVYLVYEALLGSAYLSGNSIAAGLRGQF